MEVISAHGFKLYKPGDFGWIVLSQLHNDGKGGWHPRHGRLYRGEKVLL